MRGVLILLSAAAMAACAGDDSAGEGAATGEAGFGQDPIALRVAAGGGLVRAYQYPRLESPLWTSTNPVGAQARFLAFDPENGLDAFVGRDGTAGWVDLRVGAVKLSGARRISGLQSSDAWSIYGVVRDTILHRSTPSGEWEFSVPGKVTFHFPLRDGGLIVIHESGEASRLIRLRPPEARLADSAEIATPGMALVSPLGDRLYLAFGHEVAALEVRTFNEVGRIRFDAPVVAMTATPSGDRVFIATEHSRAVEIIDRYSGELRDEVRLPGPVSELRVDPLGRLLLARPDSGDSAWVVSVGTSKHVTTLPTEWRDDLPTVAPDGSVASLVGKDVHFTIPGQEKPRHVVQLGSAERWHFVFWNGFRPRSPGLDQPVVFPGDSAELAAQAGDTAQVRLATETEPEARTAVPPLVPEAVEPTPQASRSSAFSVQLAALLSEERAREVAASVRVEGVQGRVVVSTADGTRIYRVVIGPYPSRADAERAGRLSGRSYFVFEGVP